MSTRILAWRALLNSFFCHMCQVSNISVHSTMDGVLQAKPSYLRPMLLYMHPWIFLLLKSRGYVNAVISCFSRSGGTRTCHDRPRVLGKVCFINSRLFGVQNRKPTGMYTALVAQQEGEYRYVNSRLLTNAQGSAHAHCPTQSIRHSPLLLGDAPELYFYFYFFI